MEDPDRTAEETLAARLSALGASGEVLEAEAWSELAAIEEQLWQRLAEAEEEAPAREGARGHPLIAPGRRWRRRLVQAGLVEEAAEVDALLDRLQEHQVELWREGNRARGEDADPGVWFRRLRIGSRLEASTIDSERDDWSPSPALVEERAHLRARLARAVEEARGSVPRGRWTDVLVDAADEALTGVDDLPPAHAARQLETLQEELAWHVAQVETEPGVLRRRLLRRSWRLRAEAIERRLQARLEGIFGSGLVAWWERGILAAIAVVLALMVLPALVELGPVAQHRLLIADSLLCGYFLWDFAVKAYLVRGNLGWIGRHFLTDLLPALPFPLLLADLQAGDARGGRTVLLLRLLRLPRLARYLRLAMPLIRLARVLGFLLRGLDRLVRRYGRILDFDVILHPTPQERRRSRMRAESSLTRLWRMVGTLDRLWSRTLAAAPSETRARLATLRMTSLEAGVAVPWSPPAEDQGGVLARTDTCADDLLQRLAAVRAEEVEGELGSEFVARIARALRTVARSPLRWLPFLRGYVPRAVGELSDAEVTACATRRAATGMARHLGRLRWMADLYGTLSPSDLVGRVGATLVRRTARPAVRLAMLGGAYLLLAAMGALFGIELAGWLEKLGDLLGVTLLVIGGVCFLALGCGVWMQRLASDASLRLTQVATAQFLHTTEAIRVQGLERDAELLDERVFALERRLHGEEDPAAAERDRRDFVDGVRRWLARGRGSNRSTARFDTVGRAALLYRDVVDGALLVEGDTRTTSHLLGNLALERLRASSQRVSQARERALQRLDLERRRTFFGGPWLWSHLVSRAICQQVARLIVDYNAHALPVEDRASACPETLAGHHGWLASRLSGAGVDSLQRAQRTAAFTALHFLDDDPRRDAAVEARFGSEVLGLLRRDRRALYRRVFSAYPLHLLPTEKRVLNLRDLYRRWAEGGRILLAPLRLALRAGEQSLRALRFLGRSVQEVRNPRCDSISDPAAECDFATAARKIHRMRAPVAEGCLWVRALVDVEYLGVALPGCQGGAETRSHAEADLEFLEASFETCERVAEERRRAAGDVARLQEILEGGLWQRLSARSGAPSEPSAEHLRALTVAYHGDYHGLRSKLSAQDLLVEVFARVSGEIVRPAKVLPRPGLARRFGRWWSRHGTTEPGARLRAWRAVLHDVDGVAGALQAWATHGAAAAREQGEELLAEVLRHPGAATEQLANLRAIQTQTLIDLRSYIQHVWRLGDYEADCGPPPQGV